VGEVFEVMTQVDHVLTLVNQFDRQLRLIKNLGCHSPPGKPPLMVVDLGFWQRKRKETGKGERKVEEDGRMRRAGGREMMVGPAVVKVWSVSVRP
jgi:hypothetical protein